MLECSERLLAILYHIQQNLSQKILVDDLAHIACLSRSRFLHYFKECMGISPMAYLRQQRIKQAQTMLSIEDRSISEIAEAVGFVNTFHFSRTFKEVAGIPPTEFRQQAKQQLYGISQKDHL